MQLRTLLAAGSLLALLTASPALAADQPAPVQPSDKTAAGDQPLDQDQAQQTIIVTAQLREQRQVDVPFAVTAYTGKFLDQQGIQEFEDLARFTPGLSVQNQ